MRESEDETNFSITLRKVANSHDLYRTEKRHKPCMIVPWTLIFGIREISVFQFIEVFPNDGQWNSIRAGLLRFDEWLKFASIVPGGVV